MRRRRNLCRRWILEAETGGLRRGVHSPAAIHLYVSAALFRPRQTRTEQGRLRKHFEFYSVISPQ